MMQPEGHQQEGNRGGGSRGGRGRRGRRVNRKCYNFHEDLCCADNVKCFHILVRVKSPTKLIVIEVILRLSE